MNCNQCLVQYSTQKQSLPRVLINCGHTLCQSCIEKTFKDRQLVCPQCRQISYGISFHQYPVNATLLALLKLKDEDMCKIHNQKLQAYCEKDNQLLCLNCIINGPHKSHKISSVSQKVSKDRTILKQCMRQIEQSNTQIQSILSSTTQSLDKLDIEYKDYLLELGLCFNNLHQLLSQVQKLHQEKIKIQYETIRDRYLKLGGEMKEKRQFMGELAKIYEEVVCLPNIQYLHQDNKRLFIIQNCKYRKNKVQFGKIVFNKLNLFNEVSMAIQQVVNYQKKLQGQGQATPVLKSKKSNRTKQPTILQVNLNQQYRKHFKSTIQMPVTVGSVATTLPMKSNKAQKPNNSKTVNHVQNQMSRTPKQQKNGSEQKKQLISITGSSKNERVNNSFHSECLPISMINSFMESSNQSLSIRGSEADFTVLSYDQKIFHFGGLNNSTVQYGRIDEPKSRKCISANIQRSKAQCAIIPSYSQSKCLIFGGKSPNDEKLQTFLQYDLHSHKWNPSLFKLSQQKSGFGICIKQNKLYLAGGSNTLRSLRSFEEYRITPNSMVKTDLPNMNHCRDQFGMVLGFDGRIYVSGGINQSGAVLASCERFDLGKGKWEIVAGMNKPRRSFVLVSLPHGIYAIGGYDGNQYLKDVELYDFTLEKWIVVASMNQPRFAHTALVTADLQSIVVSGGFYKKPLKSTQIFDIIHEKWIQGAPLQTQRFLHCSLIFNF